MNLFYLSDVRYGGWPTFTAHLARGLQAIGQAAHIFKITDHSEGRSRKFGRGLPYRNVSLDEASNYAEGGLIVVAAKKRQRETERLLDAGAGLVIHDPTEVKGEASRIVKKAKRLFTVREANLDLLQRLGGDPRYMPHPYLRCPVRAIESAHRQLACSISRIDFDKHTDLIASANVILGGNGQRIAIYGAENRLYTHHKLSQKFPQWADNYRGNFDSESLWGGVKIARRYRTVVDMSVIVGDGGGTQYTHLEALDAGCNLVLSTGWKREGGEINPYAHFVPSAEALASIVVGLQLDQTVFMQDTVEPEPLFIAHDAATVASEYMEAMR